jgi:hypothetical protein
MPYTMSFPDDLARYTFPFALWVDRSAQSESWGRFQPRLKGIEAPTGMPGGFLSLSANGNRDGILRSNMPFKDDAFYADVQGVLRAFDANSLTPLWSSDIANGLGQASN